MTPKLADSPRSDIWAITVDPLEDFLKTSGPFHQAFPEGLVLPGYDETLSAAARAECVRQHLEDNMQLFSGKVHNVLCRSRYFHNQFEREAMEELCTTDSGRESVLNVTPDREIIKTDNSLFSSPDLENVPAPKVVIMQGLTLTSCVAISVNNAIAQPETQTKISPTELHYPLPAGWEDTIIIAVRDASAYRPGEKNEAKANAIFDAWEADKTGKVYVANDAETALAMADRLAA